MKKHALCLIPFLLCFINCFSQKKDKPDKWIKNTISISYDKNVHNVNWDIFGGTYNVDSIEGLGLQLVNLGLVWFDRSGNFHDIEVGGFSISNKKRKIREFVPVLGITHYRSYSKDLVFTIQPKWQYNFKLSHKNSRNRFFIGAGILSSLKYERKKPISIQTYPRQRFRKTNISTHFIITPRILIIKKKKLLIDIGLTKTIYKFQKIFQNWEHGAPDREEKVSYSSSELMPIDFAFNIGIGLQLQSEK
ncbi:MAG: hypothetical protein AAFZ15_02925 [Bacteroidota bacterium]